MSVPNQNIIIIHRDAPKANFLQIKNENWQNMLITTKDFYALALYLYLASNKDDYRLELSPQAIKNAIGMARSTYYKKLDVLKNFGYIKEKQGNVYEFFEVPRQEKNASGSLSDKPNNLLEKQESLTQKQQNLGAKQDSLSQEQQCSAFNREIDNIYNINNINNPHNNIQSQKPKKKEFIF